MPAVVVVVAYAASTAAVSALGGVAALGWVAAIGIGAVVGAMAGGITAGLMGEDILTGIALGAGTGALTALAAGATAEGSVSMWGEGATAVEGASTQASTAMVAGDMTATEGVEIAGSNMISTPGADLSAAQTMVGEAGMSTEASVAAEQSMVGSQELVAEGGKDALVGGEVGAGGKGSWVGTEEAMKTAGVGAEKGATEGLLGMSTTDKMVIGSSLVGGLGDAYGAKTTAEAAKEAADKEYKRNKPKLQDDVQLPGGTFRLDKDKWASNPTNVNNTRPQAPVSREAAKQKGLLKA